VHKSTEIFPEAVQPKQEFVSREFRLFDRYEMQGVLVEALENTKHHRHLAEKVMGCHKKFRKRVCDQNHSWARAQNSCSCRMCPHCSHRRAGVLGRRTQALIVGKAALRYVVLAERNCKHLKAGIISLYQAWTSLRRSMCWKGKVKGSIAVLEVTYNKKRRTWHPHLNVLIEGEYFPFAELNLAWKKATDSKGRTTHIQQANEGTVKELLKYTLKVAERNENGDLQLILDEPAPIDEFLSAVYGLRLVRTYGSFHGLKVADEEAPDEEECPDCGSKCIVDVGPVCHSQLSFDFEKEVWRVTAAVSLSDRALHLARYFPPPMYSTSPEAIAKAVEARQQRTRYERAVSDLFAKEAA
jgi:hypothetical protein